MIDEPHDIIESEESVDNYTESVKSTIQGYKGAKDKLAALAQEPTQNAKDNPMKKGDVPHIIFEVTENNGKFQLTITDENTKGLDGKKMKPTEVMELVSKGESHKVSNFTAMHSDNLSPKKEGSSKNGSRGQGKKALLFHSRSLNKNNIEIMSIVVDSLAKDHTNKNLKYRTMFIGALPYKTVLIAEDDDAKKWLTEIDYEKLKMKGKKLSEMDLNETKLSLKLKPLTKNGTRITISNLHEETLEGIVNGTFKKWLERIWWKAIIDKQIKITLKIPNSKPEIIKPLEYWKNEPWKASDTNYSSSKGTKVWEDIPEINSSAKLQAAQDFRNKNKKIKIKRIVFDWDLERESEEINLGSDQSELSGVQWLRSGQWIKTDDIDKLAREVNETNFKNGFRGFIEFDEDTEAYLKHDDVESPQHDDYQHPNSDLDKIKLIIQEKFDELAIDLGWKVAFDEEESLESNAQDRLLNLGLFNQGKGLDKPSLNTRVMFETKNKKNNLKYGDKIENIHLELSSSNNIPLFDIIYPKSRLLPNKKPEDVYRSQWDQTEETLIVIIYKLHGTNIDFNNTMVRKFIDFTSRSNYAVTAKLKNCEAYENDIESGPYSNYSSTLPEIFDENINKKDEVLMKSFNKIIEKRQNEIKFDKSINCIISVLKPDNEKIEIYKNNYLFDKDIFLDGAEIIENECKDILLDKNGEYSQKGTYKIQAEWFDYFGILQASTSRDFNLEYKETGPEPADLSLYLDINNLSDPDKFKDFSYGDEIEIIVRARNRTENSVVAAFNASLETDIDNDLDTKDDIIDIKEVSIGAEYEDTIIFKFKKIITNRSPAKQNEVNLPKGRIEFKFDIFDITNLERKSPTPVEIINNFELNVNQFFVKDNIWIERENIEFGKEPFVFRTNKSDGNGNPAWIFKGDYLNDQYPEIIQYLSHPQTIKARKGTKKGKMFTENDFKDQILSDATTRLLIEKVLQTNNKSLFDEFQKNSNSLNTDNFNALQVWKKNLDLLEKTNLSTMNLSEINTISHKLSSALYLMLLNTT